MNTGDTNLIKIAERAIESGTRIAASHVEASAKLRETGEWYVANYAGENTFVKSLKWFVQNKRASAAQVAAALRVAVDELRPALREAARLVAPKVVTGTPAADARIAATVASDDSFYLDLRGSHGRARDEAYGTPEKTPAADAGEIVPEIPNGFYTVLLASAPSGYYTIKIENADLSFFTREKPGTQVAAVLTGPDNTTNYTGFAFVIGSAIKVWAKKRDASFAGWREALAILLENFESAASEYVKRSGRCFVCGRPLTTPDSIAAGIGPICAGKLSGAGFAFSFTGGTVADENAAADRLAESDAERAIVRDYPESDAAKAIRLIRQKRARPVFENGRDTNPATDTSRSAQEEIDDLFA